MARNEEDREDLIAEATALTIRGELQLPDQEELWVVGFRKNGAACLYVGSEPVFQFNTCHQLRRGFFRGRMINARNGHLVEFRKERTSEAVNLVSRVMDPAAEADFIQQMEDCLDQLQLGCERNILQVLRQVPGEIDFKDHLQRWLKSMPRPVAIAEQPNVGK